MDEVDPSLRAALDRFSVPALRPAFAAQIVAAATADRPTPLRRDPRGGWGRSGRLLIGAGALILASATAAAMGVFGPLPHTLPELAHVFVAAPPPVAAAHPRKTVALHKWAPAPTRAVLQQPAPPAIDPSERRAAIRDRLLVIRAARIAAGEPVRPLPMLQPPERAARIARRQAFTAAHPAIAARIVERVRERREHARAVRMAREQVRQTPITTVDAPAPALVGPPARARPTVAAPGDVATRLERLRRLRAFREYRRAARMPVEP